MSRPRPDQKTALITGVSGQDGRYLTRLLLAKGYIVHGIGREGGPAGDGADGHDNLISHKADVTDPTALCAVLHEARPDEVYNLAAQSSVAASLAWPKQTFEINAVGVENLLNAISAMPGRDRPRFFQASTSELFGAAAAGRPTESTPLAPENPYGTSKLHAHLAVVQARNSGLHASNGILFNHESPLRSDAFVTRKISRGVAALHRGGQQPLVLGNLDSRRDWGHARDYVEAMWLMLQQPSPDDYVIATGVTASIRDFVETAFAHVGVQVQWRGAGLAETGHCARTGRLLVTLNASVYRPASTGYAGGDPSKAAARLGWRATQTWRDLCAEMVEADLRAAA